MCGIVGIAGSSEVSDRLVEGLRRLEYRGYDSAGIAVVGGRNGLCRRRAAGKIANLDIELARHPVEGVTGIGHTRWATHGAPTRENAHPHKSGDVAVVHNGIIENFQQLRAELEVKGFKAETPVDSEAIAHLIASELRAGPDMDGAFARAVKRLRGAYALAVMNASEPGAIWVARSGCPLVIGLGEGETYIGSDTLALAGWTDKVIYLQEGDRAKVSAQGVVIIDKEARLAKRQVCVVSRAVAGFADKGGYRHFMAKEIHEQPDAVARTLSYYLDIATGQVRGEGSPDWALIDRLLGAACGTAFYAAAISKFWFEKLARLPMVSDVASQFRYRSPVIRAHDAALFVSQSGETADTLAALRHCRLAGAATLAVVNVENSSIAREAGAVAMIGAGVEIGVASTKAFTAQLAALACLAVGAARARGVLDAEAEAGFVSDLLETPRWISDALALDQEIEPIARRLLPVRDVLYLGRGVYHPLAMEGALKLKEISYIHAEGYAAGELKHGPIALIEEGTPVVVVAPFDALFEKTLSNIQEVAARGADVILITDAAGAAAAGDVAAHRVVMPSCPELIRPIVAAIPMQMLAYHTAALKGADVDQPRNLAKSVTVE